eukprot:SM000110S18922  [mRNA]  locus=s110:460538:461121:+ [translate_table: standard]
MSCGRAAPTAAARQVHAPRTPIHISDDRLRFPSAAARPDDLFFPTEPPELWFVVEDTSRKQEPHQANLLMHVDPLALDALHVGHIVINESLGSRLAAPDSNQQEAECASTGHGTHTMIQRLVGMKGATVAAIVVVELLGLAAISWSLRRVSE